MSDRERSAVSTCSRRSTASTRRLWAPTGWRAGVTVLNPRAALLAAQDKLATAQALAAAGFRTRGPLMSPRGSIRVDRRRLDVAPLVAASFAPAAAYGWRVQVRSAVAADAEAIEGIRVRGWQVAYRHVLPPRELDAMPVDASRWVRRLARPPAGWSTFVAAEDDRVVGFASVGPSRDESGVGELYAIYVDPDAWSEGVGRALILSAEERLAADYGEATLWVLEDNPRARRFYEAAGWRPDGVRKVEDRWGVAAAEVRYRKRLSSSTSRR